MAGEHAEVTVTTRRLGKGLGSGEAVDFWESNKPRDLSKPDISGPGSQPPPVTTHTHTVSASRMNPCLPAGSGKSSTCATLTVTVERSGLNLHTDTARANHAE